MSFQPELSLCIPAYEMGGFGGTFLKASLERLLTQTWKNFEVVVSDQANDNSVSEVCEAFSSHLHIRRYSAHHIARCASANINHALDRADAPICKILFQDDLVTATTALEQVFQGLKSSTSKWLVNGWTQTMDGISFSAPRVPTYHPHIHYGKNSISSPSVLAFVNDVSMRFDENLIWLMDVDFYKRCFEQWGLPVIIEAPLVANREHAGQVSESVSRAMKWRELWAMHRKFGAKESRADALIFYRRLLASVL